MSLSSSLNSFTHKLFNQIGAGKNENFFISPFSISTALAMCYAGAKHDTAHQLRDLLSLSKLSHEQILDLNHQLISSINSLGGVIIKTANKLYPKEGYEILGDYLSTLKKNFNADAQSLNYGNASGAAKTINDWVSAQTNDKIKDLINPNVINDLTRLILVNAIHFKGNWDVQFDKNLTAKEDFHLADGSVKKVDMMKSTKNKFRYIYKPVGIDADICEFPYVGKNISMTIILPHVGQSIEKVEGQLDDVVINDILSLQIPLEKVNLQVPKFKLEFKSELSEHFKKMGITVPFDEKQANFGGITSDPKGLYISKVIHQAVVEVNEEGTEAAAATGVVMMTRMAVIFEPANFICNRPFLFLIHEKKHNGVLFFGKYTKPE